MDPFKVLEGYFVGGVVAMTLSITFALCNLALFVIALVDCIKRENEKDRLLWVLVIVFVPLIGAILYFAIGRPSRSQSSSRPIAVRKMGTDPLPTATANSPAFDHAAMHDEKKRAAAINEALSSLSAEKRQPRR